MPRSGAQRALSTWQSDRAVPQEAQEAQEAQVPQEAQEVQEAQEAQRFRPTQ